MAEKVALPFRERFLQRVRVIWFIDRGHYGHGHLTAVYADGTCDVQSDNGPHFKGWNVSSLEPE